MTQPTHAPTTDEPTPHEPTPHEPKTDESTDTASPRLISRSTIVVLCAVLAGSALDGLLPSSIRWQALAAAAAGLIAFVGLHHQARTREQRRAAQLVVQTTRRVERRLDRHAPRSLERRLDRHISAAGHTSATGHISATGASPPDNAAARAAFQGMTASPAPRRSGR